MNKLAERLKYFYSYFESLFEVLDKHEIGVEEMLEEAVDLQGFKAELSRLFPEVEIIGGMAVGIVVHSTLYPDIVAKYCYSPIEPEYFEGESGLPSDIVDTVISYSNFTTEDIVPRAYKKGYKILQNLPVYLRKYLVETLEVSEGGCLILNKYEPDVSSVITVTRQEKGNFLVTYNVELTKRTLLQYISLLKKGIFISDFTTDNFTYNRTTGDLLLLDLDCLVYSAKLEAALKEPTNLTPVIRELFNIFLQPDLHAEFYEFIESALRSKTPLQSNLHKSRIFT